MAKLLTSGICLALGVLFTHPTFSEAYAENALGAENNIEQTQLEIKKIKDKITAAEKTYKSAQSSYARYEKKIAESERAISKNTRQHRDLKKQIQATQSALHLSAERIEALNLKITQQKLWLNQELIQAYKQGSNSSIKLVFNGQSPSDTLRLIKYANIIQTERQKKLDELTQDQVKVFQLQKEQQTQSQKLAAQETELQKNRSELQNLKAQHQKLLNKSKNTMANSSQNISKLTVTASHLESMLDEMILKEQMAEESRNYVFSQQKGRLPWPLTGKLYKTYNTKKSSFQLFKNDMHPNIKWPDTKWKGIWLETQKESEVLSIAPGYVVFSDWLRDYGLLTIVDHGQGFFSLYGHTQTLLTEPGQWVQQGEAIAITQKSSPEKFEGVYFEIRQNSQAMNPLAWLSKK